MAVRDAGAALDPAVAETHSGVVFFLGDRAYKLKKAVNLGFLDFSTREAREAICHREVELNRRLAPDVYLGVSDVLDPEGNRCDHLVVMRRMPDDRRLSALIARGADVAAEIGAIAELLAEFHSRAERSPAADRAAGADALAARWSANSSGLAPFAGGLVEGAMVEEVDRLAHRYLAGRRPLFDRRIAGGRACDGHGDLLADDIFCLDDGPRVLDCLEFDDALRLDDALADAAFLAMDLESLGRADLAERFLGAYRSAADDSWPPSLSHHHIAYRAQVRAKVSAIRADQRGDESDTRAAELLSLARRHLDAGRVRLVLVGGLPGTGKSTLAAGLAAALGATVLRSDEVRKELAGIEPHVPAGAGFGEGVYSAEHTASTYRELLARAGGGLELGETVVLDASWTSGRERAHARALADATFSDLVELECRTSAEVATRRIAERARRGGDPSDADAAIAAAMATIADPWPAAIPIETTAPPAEALRAALAVVGPDAAQP